MIQHRKQRVELVVYEPRWPESHPDVVGIGQVTVDGVHMRPLLVRSTDGGKTLSVSVVDMFGPQGGGYVLSLEALPDPCGPTVPDHVREEIVRLITERARAEGRREA